MASHWIEFFKDESLAKGSRTNKLVLQKYNHYEQQLPAALDKGVDQFQIDISKSQGNNILLVQTVQKHVQVFHSVRVATHPESLKKFSFGIQGLDKFSPVLQIHEKSIIKKLGPGNEGVSTREGGASLYPSPADFSVVDSTEEFKTLEGSLPISEDSRINKLPNFTFFHPYLLVRTYHGRSMAASELGYQIIQTVRDEKGSNANKTSEPSKGIVGCYDLLLFLWAIDRGFGAVAKISNFPHSDTISSLIEKRLNELEDWNRKKTKSTKTAGTRPTPDTSLKKSEPVELDDEDEILDTHYGSGQNRKENPEEGGKRKKSTSQETLKSRTRLRSTSLSEEDRTLARKPKDLFTPNRKSHKDDEDRSESTPTRGDLPRERDRRSHADSRKNPPRRSRSRSPNRKESPYRRFRNRSRTPPRDHHTVLTRLQAVASTEVPTRAVRRRARGRPTSRSGSRSRSRSPSPRRDREVSNRSRRGNRNKFRETLPRRSHRTAGQGGDDFYDDDDESGSESESGRGRQSPRRGDDRDPYRRRRRSPSDDDDPREGGDHRGGRRDDRGRSGNSGSNRRSGNSRSRSRSRSRDSGRNRRRNENREGRRRRDRSRSPPVDMGALMIQGMTTLLTNQGEALKAQREAKEREEKKKSLLNKLYDGAADSFKFLSAEDWKEKDPQVNGFMSKVMEDKDITKALGYFMAATQDWPGQVSRKGLTEFLTQGFRAYDINKSPGGFTIFMCAPNSTRLDRTEEERRLAIKAAYGDIKLDDGAIRMYAKKELYIPENIYEAEEQIETCVCLLELITVEGGIASEGYLHGLRYFRKHRAMFQEALLVDPLLLTRYLYMLDRVFQRFVKELERFYHRSHPLLVARDSLKGSMIRSLEDMMRGFEYGSIPSLILPRSLSTTNSGPTTRSPLGNRQDQPRGKDQERGKGNQKKPDSGNPQWWGTNENVQEVWTLPSGKSYKDYFSSIVESHKENIKGWPKLPHHFMERAKPMCIRYQCTGKCSEKCMMAHVNPKDIGAEAYDAITKKFKQVFGSYTSTTVRHHTASHHHHQEEELYRNDEAQVSPSPRKVNPFLESDTEESETDTQLRERRRTSTHRPKPDDHANPSVKGRETQPYKRKASELNGSRPYTIGEGRRSTAPKIRHQTENQKSPQEVEDDSDGSNETDDEIEIPHRLSRKERRAMERNAKRIRKKNAQDNKTIRKYLPADINLIFSETIRGADDNFTPPPWLLPSIKEVARMPVKTPSKPNIVFDTTPEALEHNTALLEDFDFDFESFLSSQADTTLEYGSEFRPIDQLREVLGNHPNFPFFENVLQNGMQYHFKKPLSEEERAAELAEQIKRGNHKSAQNEAEVAEMLLYKDVTHGFAMPIKAEVVERIKGAMVEPCGVANQFKLQSDGSRKLAARLTHDLSHSITSDDAAVNKRIDMEQYTEMIYGWCLSRIIHFIVALRIAHPDKKIFIAKYDYSDAYRRVAHAASAAVQTILIVAHVAYIMLRLAFGGSPNPPTWCAFSEMVTDLSNEIDMCEDWDPSTLRSPAQPDTPTPESLADNIPFAEGKPLAVEIPVDRTARTDSFIDDLIRIFLDTLDNRERSPHAVPLAIHVTSRPHAGEEEPIQRRGLLSASKLEAEGLPVEIQIVLGWDIDARRLLVLLPQDKFIAWSCDLDEVIRSKRVSFKDLDSLVGRLNHVAYLIPLARHFLHRFRTKLKVRLNEKQILTMSKEDIEDLLLWGDYLLMARQGISLNRLTIRHPTRLGWADSCPYGLGGYSFHGWAWRLRIPPDSPIYGVAEVNNVLEFLALGITIWIMLSECSKDGIKEACILILGDNTSALGWLYRTRFFSKDSFYYASVNMIARQIARIVVKSSHCLASQHIKGELNVVADLLSFAETRTDAKPHPIAFDGPDDETLTQRFHIHFSQFIPQSFKICPMPEDVLSFATRVLQTLELSFMQSKNRPTKAGTESGAGGKVTAGNWVSPITTSSLTFQVKRENSWPDLSCPSTVMLDGINQESMLDSVKSRWYQALSEMPQAIWLRRFGTVSNKAPFTSKGARGFYSP